MGFNLLVIQIDSVEAIRAKLVEKLHPSDPSHLSSFPGAQLPQLKELGCGKKPYLGCKLLLGKL